jgi:hypothetical protein
MGHRDYPLKEREEKAGLLGTWGHKNAAMENPI